MSRIGRQPVELPAGVEVQIQGPRVMVKGPKGELARTFPSEIQIEMKEGTVRLQRASDEPRIRALHGLSRALLNNMVVGVSDGFSRELQVEGVGYRPELDGKDLVLHVGYSHPVRVPPPAGITFDVDAKARQIRVHGSDKELVGQVAADIRKVRPPEPYKGKGIRYVGERVRHKAGKAGKVA
ncbi:MAG TPA: 50S ribosomal protein L6 [Anaerolineales bacterium]|nr:50S ribosomal protein L6 [Anaerolineales bacterium]